jgi:hypothetical protein
MIGSPARGAMRSHAGSQSHSVEPLVQISRAGVNRYRSACRRWTTPREGAGRLHTAREALDAVAIARAFDRHCPIDHARPDQTPEMWADELNLAIETAEHLSLYQRRSSRDAALRLYARAS